MSSLVVPPSPNWYESSILACSPDNTLIYGARCDIVILENSKCFDIPATVKIIPKAHTQKIIAVDINRNWNNPKKYIVSAGEDKILNVWDAETLKKKISHNAHVNHEKLIGCAFAGDDRVISVSGEGIVVVFNIPLNTTNVLNHLFNFKVTVTCMSVCPHATWLVAFGLKNGLVMVADLRKNGKILHKLRGHEKSVISLAWCPASINIFPRNPGNYVGMKGEKVIYEGSDGKDANVSTVDLNKEEGGNESEAEALNCNERSSESTEKPSEEVLNDTNSKKDSEVILQEKPEIDSKKTDSTKISNSTSSENCQAVEIKKDSVVSEEANTIETTTGSANESEYSSDTQVLSDAYLTKDSDVHENVTLHENQENCHNISDQAVDIQKESCVSGEANVNKMTSGANENEDSQGTQVLNDSVIKNDYDVHKNKVLQENKEISDQNDSTEKTNSMTDKNCPNMDGQETSVSAEPTAKETTSDTNVNESEDSTCNDAGIDKDQQESLERNNLEVSDLSTIKEESDNTKCDGSGIEEQKSIEESNLDVSAQSTTDKRVQTCEEAERHIVANVAIEEEPRKEFLLASSAKENKIYIWRAGTDGRLQTFLTFKSNNRKNHNPDKNWITLHWATPTKLLSSTKTAELVQWTLPKGKGNSNLQTLVHNEHHTQLFSIVGPLILFNESNWHQEPDMNVWTTCQDRLILNTSLSSKRNILSAYPAFGSSVGCLQLSPLDPNRLAMGTSDGFIKLLDLSKPNINVVNMVRFYQKIQSKVMSLAWHPSNEVFLAYGTYEGRVGHLDVSNVSKSPILFPQYFKTQIHKVEYGPLNGNKDQHAVYALSEGNIAIFNATNSKEDPIILEKPDESYIYTFSWKPDYSMLVVSTKKNTLIKYSSDLKISEIKYVEHKMQEICWHPNAADGKSNSKYSNCFASISNPKQVLVLNFGNQDVDGEIELIMYKYEGMSDMINWISWSPYEANHLAIATESGYGVIWDMENNVNIATYCTANFDSLLTILWSPLDKNLMISTLKDHTLRIWKISDHPPVDEKVLKESKKKALIEIQARTSEHHSKDSIPEEGNVKPKKSASLIPNFNSTEVIKDLRKLLSWKENPSDDSTQHSNGKPNILNIFGTNDNMKNFVKTNEQVFQKRGQYHQKTQLSLFRGDISSSIRQAISEKRVDLFIISLAPMVSPKLWQEACETYADQLSNEANSDPLEIANYYLACHKVDKALESLCQRSMFREALMLAKCRFMENDKTIIEIMEKWAKDALLKGNFELSAQCYIFLGKYEDAACVLYRRTDLEILAFATELAEKSGNTELHKAVMMRYNTFSAAKHPEAISNGIRENESQSENQEGIVATQSFTDNGLLDSNSDNNDTIVTHQGLMEKLSEVFCSTVNSIENVIESMKPKVSTENPTENPTENSTEKPTENPTENPTKND